MASHHPVRERLTRQLMIALHTSGRQAEALDAYSAYRTTLRDNFGLDPASSLQRLHLVILSGDPVHDIMRYLRPAPAR
jgi:DNA-binding SARP family transcriptional activator